MVEIMSKFTGVPSSAGTPYELIAFVKIRMNPDRIDGSTSGMTIRRRTVNRFAPATLAASSSWLFIELSAAPTIRKKNTLSWIDRETTIGTNPYDSQSGGDT